MALASSSERPRAFSLFEMCSICRCSFAEYRCFLGMTICYPNDLRARLDALAGKERNVAGRHEPRDVAEDRVRNPGSRLPGLHVDPGDDKLAGSREIIVGRVVAGQSARIAVPTGAAGEAEAE